jgi:hypothetical protein
LSWVPCKNPLPARTKTVTVRNGENKHNKNLLREASELTLTNDKMTVKHK